MSLSLAGHVACAAAAYLAVRRSGFRPDLLHAHFFLAAGPARLISLATGTRMSQPNTGRRFSPKIKPISVAFGDLQLAHPLQEQLDLP